MAPLPFDGVRNMKKNLALIAFAALVVTPTAAFAQGEVPAAVVATEGKPLFTANGQRLGTVYSLAQDGSPQVIVNGKLVTVPAATISLENGKFTTSLTRQAVLTRR